VTWTEPEINGAAVLSYTITFRHSDGITYSTELSQCDGSDATIVSSRTCVIDVATFLTAPFNLDWGESVYAKI
jgi:hypothetical protein